MSEPTVVPVSPSSRRPWPLRVLAILGAWLVLEVVMVGLAVGWVAIYSHLIAPGHAVGHYEAYAQRVTPWVALSLSAPVFGAFGFLCARRRGRSGAAFALTVTWVLLAIDAAFIGMMAGTAADAWFVFAAAGVLKLGGVLLGGRLGTRAGNAPA